MRRLRARQSAGFYTGAAARTLARDRACLDDRWQSRSYRRVHRSHARFRSVPRPAQPFDRTRIHLGHSARPLRYGRVDLAYRELPDDVEIAEEFLIERALSGDVAVLPRFSLCANIASAPELNAFAIAVTACPLLALLLSVGLLNRALKRHRFQAATFHSSHILP